MIFGYVRISTTKDTQTTARQVKALKDYAKENDFTFDEIVEEKKSAKNFEDRQGYKGLRNKLRKGDILVIVDLDRLSRNAMEGIQEIQGLKKEGIKLVALDTPYLNQWNNVSNDSMYDMISDILITLKLHIAQQEREKIVSRINQGLDVAREKGVKLGRPTLELPKEFKKYYDKMVNKEISKVEMSKLLGVSRKHLYTMIEKYESNK